MVAGAFGDMAVGEILLNWFPILMMAVPVVLAFLFRNRICSDQPLQRRMPLKWVGLAAAVQLIAMGIVLCCGSGVLSLRYIYYQAAAPVLEVQNFGMLTQTQLEVRRVLSASSRTTRSSPNRSSGGPGASWRARRPWRALSRRSTPWTSTLRP